MLLKGQHQAAPDGLAGNEDCGQMSAWYVMSALGIYNVCPGGDQYAIGSPVVDKAVIHLENGKTFTIKANNNSKGTAYISGAKLNGSNYTKSYLSYGDISNGGEIDFDMSAAPNKSWGSSEADVPVTKID
jgi:putative alpha-1,2-mannosidase